MGVNRWWKIYQFKVKMKNNETAATIARWTKHEAELGNMLPRKPEDILKEIEDGLGHVVFKGQVPIAYCRMKLWPKSSAVELGSMVVEPEHRRNNTAIETTNVMIGKAQQKFPGSRIFVLAENIKSQSLASKIGGASLDKNELDDEVWELCKEPGQECSHFLSGEFPDNCPCVLFDFTHLAKK